MTCKRSFKLWCILGAIVVLTLAATSPLMAAGQGAEAEEEPTLVWVNHSGGRENQEAMDLWLKEIHKLTGIKLKFIKPTDAESVMKISSMLAAGEQVDLVYLDWDRFDDVTRDNPDLFIPLEDRIKKSDVFSDTEKFPPEFWEQMRKPDGHIYATRIDNNWGQGGTLPIVRWDWVEKLGFAEKVEGNEKLTLDDYYELLYAFVHNDPDGNGQDDTYGFAMGYTLYESQPFFGTVGAIRQYAMDENGKIYVPYSQPNTKPVWEFLRRLYREKILEPNFVTNRSSNFVDLFLSDKLGMIGYWANSIHNYNGKVHSNRPDSPFRARAIHPPVGPDGTAVLRTSPPRIDAIPASSKYQDEAFRLLEFFQTEEGAILATVGIEGYDYNWENGKIVRIGDRGQGAGLTPGWNWEPPWSIAEEWLEALRIVSKTVRTNKTYGRSGDQWEEVTGIDGARIIRSEVSVEQGLEDMRERLKKLDLIDY